MSESLLVAAALDDRYIIERELGAGGMAVVYLAHDRKLDRDVALKVLRPELGAVLGAERFLAEIKITARLDHPHILTLIDSGEANGFLYYVLPFVRGESLRARLNRERQLAIDEALAITRQVASALDYAHRHGLVHRDIKPENILLQEGEAMLADFGIALAVKEAGGNRLTQTGLSLGTPQYMSPEQATGDRGIDARSDVYSLAAVLYEMLAGEPPVTGASAQSMIAKLMTEQPTHVRVLRDSVSIELDAAITRALSKTPADRFTSAGDFARALDAKPSPAPTAETKSSRRRVAVVGAAAVGVIALGAAAVAFRGRKEGSATLGDKTQLTSTGTVLDPAISPDGKQLAFVTRHCSGAACTYSAVVQDVGGTTTRTILDGATAAYELDWSPDRRNLLFSGTIGGHASFYLLSALGGTPRFLNSGAAAFYAGGDSLLIGPIYRPDSVFYIRVAGLDGAPRDSIRVAGKGQGLAAVSTVPGTNFILTLIVQAPHGLWQVIDRAGRVADHVVNACTCGGIATKDAVWLSRAGSGLEESVVRIALDRDNGHLATHQDTMAHGLFTQFSLTSDGASMVMDAGTFDHNVWAVSLADALKGKLSDDHRIAHSSSPVAAGISPDGANILLRRALPTAGGVTEIRYSVMPFAGGSETPLSVSGSVRRAKWTDASTVAVATETPRGMHFVDVDVHTGAQRNAFDVGDSTVSDFGALPNGWVWIPATRDRLIVVESGRRREFRSLAWFTSVHRLTSDPAHQRVFYYGFGGASGDSISAAVLSLGDGTQTRWATRFGESADIEPLAGHEALLELAEGQDTWSLFALDGPGKLTPLGTVPHPLLGVSVSADMSRAVATERDYHADAWVFKVVKR